MEPPQLRSAQSAAEECENASAVYVEYIGKAQKPSHLTAIVIVALLGLTALPAMSNPYSQPGFESHVV
jgi:hypothetical protein